MRLLFAPQSRRNPFGGSILRRCIDCVGFLVVALFLVRAAGAISLPDPPVRYLTDQSRTLRPAAVEQLNAILEQLARQESTQVVVYLDEKVPDGEELNDYVNRLFAHWKIGQKGKDNGVLLAVFVKDRKLRIEVGYGLEGKLTDALAGRIIRDEITPRLREGDFEGGIRSGVQAIVGAVRGEYTGAGRTAASTLPFARGQSPRQILWIGAIAGGICGFLIRIAHTSFDSFGRALILVLSGIPIGAIGFPITAALFFRGIPVLGFFCLFFVFFLLGMFRRRGAEYGRGGRHRIPNHGWNWGSSWSGGSSSSSFGGFSGGGGRSGGGGASGSW